MKREIKFRAWDKENQEWADGHFWMGKVHANYLITAKPSVMEMFHENYEITQFTGLRDKNGKEIYEGDIISYSSKMYLHMEKDIHPVKLFHGQFRTDISTLWAVQGICEIIGNIYENPELLEAK